MAFAAGVPIAIIGYLFSKYIIKHHGDKYAASQIVRTVVQVGFLFALFIVSENFPQSRVGMLIGGCLGITVPMAFFTVRLVKYNNSLNEKGGSADG